jgi:hypothetical protein
MLMRLTELHRDVRKPGLMLRISLQRFAQHDSATAPLRSKLQGILPPKFFVRHRWKSLEFSKEPLNIRYDEPGRLRELSWQKAPDQLNKCSA